MKPFVTSFYNWYRQTLRHAKYRWILIAGTLIYLLSPIDISPDFIPIAGLIDDGIVITVLAAELSQMLAEGLSRRKGIKIERDLEREASNMVVDVTAQ